MEQPFKIPRLPRILTQNKSEIITCLPAPGSSYDSEIWMQWFDGDHDLAAIVRRFPGAITRDQVASLCNGGFKNVRRLFLASMVWGYFTAGVGPYRTKRILESPDAISVMQSAAALVASGRIRHAYDTIKKIRGFGPAFFTKFLYFIGLGVKINPLPVILDTRVAGALEKLGKDENWDFNVFAKVSRNRKNEITFLRPYAEGYMQYVDTLDEWSKALGCPRADYIEYFLFKLN